MHYWIYLSDIMFCKPHILSLFPNSFNTYINTRSSISILSGSKKSAVLSWHCWIGYLQENCHKLSRNSSLTEEADCLQFHSLNPCPAELFHVLRSSPIFILLICSIQVIRMYFFNQSGKECGSWSDGFIRRHLIWIHSVFNKR